MIEIIDVRDANDWKADAEETHRFLDRVEDVANKELFDRLAIGKKVTEIDIHNAVMAALIFCNG